MRPEQRDSYRLEFRTRVRAVREDGPWVELEPSYFYPTSGGQPHDTGRIGDARVVDVRIEHGTVWHRLEGPVPTAGERVDAEVDGERRYRHMQRHTAQHLLSQAFARTGPGYATRSVSLRGPDATVDLAGDPDDDALARAEALANAFGYRAMPITSFEVEQERLGEYDLRRPAKVAGRVRLVAMGDVELSACGGTHLATTGEALPIKLLGSERIRGGLVRVTFRAGWEALEDYHARLRLSSALVRRFSAPLEELEGRVEALQRELDDARSALAQARTQAAAARAERLRAEARPAAGGVAVVRAVVALEELDATVAALQDAPGTLSALGARDGAGARVALCAGPGAEVDVRPALRDALEVLGGRGGGRPDRAQGGGPRGDRLTSALDAAVGRWAVGRGAGDVGQETRNDSEKS